MIQENLNGSVDPEDVLRINEDHSSDYQNENTGKENEEEVEEEEEEQDYDILPSNGPGLTGDDGEQVVDAGETEDDE